MSDEKLKRYYRFFPKIYKVETNPVLNAIIQGFAGANEEMMLQLENTKAQLFIKTASGQYLNRLASSLGVSRPASLGMTDDEFRELIPNLSLKRKQVRKIFYDTMDVFWGPLFSRANVQSGNPAPFNVVVGDSLKIKVDGGLIQEVKVLTGDIAISGAATSEEMQTILSRILGATISIELDPGSSNEYINIRTNTPGLNGSIEILNSTLAGSTKMDFTLKKYELWQQPMRSAIYEINPNELVLEIPAIVPALRRTLRGSHHFHTDSTLEPPVPPNNGIWQGSFMYNPSGSEASFTVSNQKAEIQEELSKGAIYTKVTVDDNSSFLEPQGEIIFNWGTDLQELPVKYRGIPNTNTILLDPAYVFQKTQPIGSMINVLVKKQPYIPVKTGKDLAVYLTSPSDARVIVEEILRSLAAAGVIVNFVILAPDYKYIIDNPYLITDDAPESN